MSTYAIYRLTDGQIVSHFSGPRRMLEVNTPPGHGAKEGSYDAIAQRIDVVTGAVINDSALAQAHQLRREAGLVRSLLMERIAHLEQRQARPQREITLARERLFEDPSDATAREQLRVATERLGAIEAEIAGLRADL